MSKLLVESRGAVRTVTLNRPEKRNALDGDLLRALEEAFRATPPAEERLTVLRANGPVFCAGLDLRNREGVTSGVSPIESMLHAIETYPLPVVGVVQGDAIAGGNELALHCDIVVASESARFGMSLAQIGLAPTWFLAKKLIEVAGPVATREILYLGDPLPARRMFDLGIIARVAPPEELDAAAQAIIDRLAANAPLSLKAMKALLVRLMAFRDQVPHEDVDRLVSACSASTDAEEGISARLARRQPAFQGR